MLLFFALKLSLFDRHSPRKPRLTEAGRMVLVEARLISSGIDTLRSKAKGMSQGLESELHLVLDVLLPEERVVDALTAFQKEFPTVSLNLRVEALGAVTTLVLDRGGVLGVSGVLDTADEIVRVAAGSVPLVSVAAPGHPLAQIDRLRPCAGRDHVQLVLTDRSELTQG